MVVRSRQPDVLGGELHFTFHPVTGDLHYQGRLTFQGLFGLKRKKLFAGSTRVEPARLRSESLKVGDVFNVSGVEAVVRVIEHQRAWVRFHAAGLGHAQGVVILDLNAEIVKVTVIMGGFTYKGIWRGMEAVDGGGDRNTEH
jgi:hypothetical protein